MLRRFPGQREDSYVPTPRNTSPEPPLDALLAEAGWVLALAKRLASDQASAEDIAQSTLALAIEKRPSPAGGLRPWLGKVATRLARRRMRSDLRRQARETWVAESSPKGAAASNEVLMRFELQQDLARRVDALPDPYRHVLVYRYFEGLSVSEIARSTGTSPSTVRSQISRGLERVRYQLGKDSKGRDVLGALGLASGSSTSIVSRRSAELVSMHTSSKVAAAVIVATAAVIGFQLSGSASPEMGQAEPLEISDERMSAAGTNPADMNGPASMTGPAQGALRKAAVPEQHNPKEAEPAPLTVEGVAPEVSTVRARILGSSGQPVDGATLAAMHFDGIGRGANIVASSDRQGRVTLELADQALRMWRGRALDMGFAAGADGHATEFIVQLPLLHGETDLGDIQLGPGGALVGVTVDSQGRALAGAHLVLGPAVIGEDAEAERITGQGGMGARLETTSREDGSFELKGIPATAQAGQAPKVRLWAHDTGRLWTISEAFAITPGEAVDVGHMVLEAVPEKLRVTGRVLRPDGLPATGVIVRADPITGQPGHQVETDEQGEFLVVPRGHVTVRLVATDPSGRLGMSRVVSAEPGESVDLKLSDRREMTLTVIDKKGAPVLNAQVMLNLLGDSGDPEDGGQSLPATGWSYTDEQGQLQLEAPPGTFLISAKKSGYGALLIGPYEHSSVPTTIRFALPGGARLTGRVLTYGQPVEGARVALGKQRSDLVTISDGFANRYTTSGSPNVLTDAEGRFDLPLKEGLTQLPVVARWHGLATGELMLELTPGEDFGGVEIHLTEGGAIEGSVTPPAGMQAAGLYVGASRGDGSPFSTRVDAEGRYRFEGLGPGQWRVEGRLEEVQSEMIYVARHPDDREFRWNAQVLDRKTLELDVDMRHLGMVEVQGQLLIDGVAPPKGWVVEVVPPFHKRFRIDSPAATLDANGNFVLSSRPGRADLRLIGPLPGGVSVEMLREINLEGTRFDWEGALTTAAIEMFLDYRPSQVRFVRGRESMGERELTIVPVTEGGSLHGRVPVGDSSLQIPAEDSSSRDAWVTIRSVLVE